MAYPKENEGIHLWRLPNKSPQVALCQKHHSFVTGKPLPGWKGTLYSGSQSKRLWWCYFTQPSTRTTGCIKTRKTILTGALTGWRLMVVDHRQSRLIVGGFMLVPAHRGCAIGWLMPRARAFWQNKRWNKKPGDCKQKTPKHDMLLHRTIQYLTRCNE